MARPQYDLTDYLACAIHVARRAGGYVSMTQREENKSSTAEDAFVLLQAGAPGVLPDEFGRAQAVVNYWAAEEVTPGMAKVRRQMAKRAHKATVGGVDGLAAYMPTAFERELAYKLERITERVAHAKSAHVGTVGDYCALQLKIMRTVKHRTEFGISLLVLLTDAAGNVFTWWTTPERMHVRHDLFFDCVAKVKAHVIYQNIAQTVLTRLKEAG